MIGIVVSDTMFSEKNFVIFNELNKAVKKIGEANLVYVNLTTQILPADFAIMNITEINNYYGGHLVATCQMTADIVAKATVNARKTFYMWDLSILLKSYDFKEMHRLLNSIDLVTRSESHAKFVQNLFGVTPTVCPDFKMEMLWT